MNRGRWLLTLAVVGLVVPAVGGCVGLEEHRQLERSNRNLKAEKAALESELYDARSLGDSLRGKLTSCEHELDVKGQLVSNLQSENDQLEKAVADAQEMLKKLADRTMPTEPVIIEKATKLPEALDSALKQFATQYPEDVEYNEATGAVKWKSDLVFALGSDVVKETARASLERFTEILNSGAAAGFEVVVVGHTDDRPIARAETRQAHPTNWHLSVHRAIAVSKIILDGGYESGRVGVMGYGEYRPIVANDTDENRARNRRVEIYLVQSGTLLSSDEHPNVFSVPESNLVFAKAVR